MESLTDPLEVDYSEIEGLPVSGVPGHAGRLAMGRIGDTEIAVARGRVHVYEGWSAREAASTIRLFHQLGVETVILTNAAGVVNPSFEPGRWMLISDHMNLARQSPLTGEARFIDQSEVYSSALRERLRADWAALDPSPGLLMEGVYAWVNGPEYETPAEIRMLHKIGADAVGMSTVPESIQARALGMRVAALSCLTNYGAGLSGDPLSHEEVMEAGRSAARNLFRLLEKSLPGMAEE